MGLTQANTNNMELRDKTEVVIIQYPTFPYSYTREYKINVKNNFKHVPRSILG